LWTHPKPRHHPKRASRDVPQPDAGEQSSCCGVCADGVSIASMIGVRLDQKEV
jgi:hypothetical protein